MQEKIGVHLGDIQKTLFLPLWGRAQETKKTDPMLKDPVAVEILDRVDFDFSTIARNLTGLSRTWIMRSICTDRVVAEVLAECPTATVVDLGCGLDTTFDRMDNGRLTWYDLDLPDVVALRNRLMRNNERRKSLAASVFDKGWLKEIKPAAKILFIAAGVLYYFDEAEIKGLFKRLADAFPGCEILFDACSPLGVKTANQMVIKQAGWDERSFLKWGLKDVRDLSAWDKRFELVKTMFYFRDARIGIPLMLFGFVSNLLKIQYMVHLRLGDALQTAPSGYGV